MRFLIILGLLISWNLFAAPEPEPELQRLNAALDRAKTQTEMNLASKKLCDYWEAKLVATENKVEARLKGTRRAKFLELKKVWRSYRQDEVAFFASGFEGGSGQSLVANSAFKQLTEHRVLELTALIADLPQ